MDLGGGPEQPAQCHLGDQLPRKGPLGLGDCGGQPQHPGTHPLPLPPPRPGLRPRAMSSETHSVPHSQWPVGHKRPSCEKLGGRRGAGRRGHSPRPRHLRLLCIRWLSVLHLPWRLRRGAGSLRAGSPRDPRPLVWYLVVVCLTCLLKAMACFLISWSSGETGQKKKNQPPIHFLSNSQMKEKSE